MNTLTRKQRKAYLKAVRRIGKQCPFCGSSEVSDVERAEVGGTWVRNEVECGKCLEDWCEIYKLVDIEKEELEAEDDYLRQ